MQGRELEKLLKVDGQIHITMVKSVTMGNNFTSFLFFNYFLKDFIYLF